jgi:hypothetical protein
MLMRIFQVVLVIAVLLFTISSSDALEKKDMAEIQSGDLIGETQLQILDSEDHMALIWWVPHEFWHVTYANTEGLTETEKENILNILKPYSLLAVCQADVSNLGAFRFYGQVEVEDNLEMTYENSEGKKQEIKPLQNLDPDLEVMLGVFKPILSAAAGNMGENMHFFVLADYNSEDERILDPYESGKIMFLLWNRSGESIKSHMDLPLNSLYVPRKCPNGENAHVTWKYCPWTGKKLPE